MFHRTLAECFPYEDLPRLWECPNVHCFYHETLMKWSEVRPHERWIHSQGDLGVVATCPSCHAECVPYEDPDGANA